MRTGVTKTVERDTASQAEQAVSSLLSLSPALNTAETSTSLCDSHLAGLYLQSQCDVSQHCVTVECDSLIQYYI